MASINISELRSLGYLSGISAKLENSSIKPSNTYGETILDKRRSPIKGWQKNKAKGKK